MNEVTREAGKIILSYSKNKNVEKKGEIDLVTAADKAAELYLFSRISELFPDDAIIAEEGNEKKGTSGNKWIIDPLDGTTSFAHGFPFYSVSVGLADHENTPILGIVYNPFFDEYFCAARGAGAWLNGEKISVSREADFTQTLIGTGFPYNRRIIMSRVLKRLENILFKVRDVRPTGSAALDISYVACGRLDGYYEEGLKAWDMAAALCILIEAGGVASDYHGNPVDIFRPETVVSNGKIHSALLETLK